MIGDLLVCLLAILQFIFSRESNNTYPLWHTISDVLILIIVFYINGQEQELFLGGSLYSLHSDCRPTSSGVSDIFFVLQMLLMYFLIAT